MGWLARLLGSASREDLRGARLDETVPPWEIGGVRDCPAVLHALARWLPEGSVLYFEGGYRDAEIVSFLAGASIPEQLHLAFGTIWPRPRVFHVPNGPAIAALAALMERHAAPELAIHLHAYCRGEVIVAWYDAFYDDPMLVAGSVAEPSIAALAGSLGVSWHRGQR